MTKTGFLSQTLAERLSDQILRQGPITFRDWMEAALYDKDQGYYCRKDLVRWGRAGDYRTSPETNTLFAATFAHYFMQLYTDLGSPQQFTIVEVGGGAGHFATEFLETLRQSYSRVFESVTYVLDEISDDSRERAAERLARFGERVKFQRLSDLAAIDAGIVFSNELLDAFPVHRVTIRDGRLRELYVGLDERQSFDWFEGPPSTPRLHAYLERFNIQLRDNQVVEVNLALEDWFLLVSEKLKRGYVVTVDYGLEAAELYASPEQNEGTIRALRRHAFATELLASPGEQDITSSIYWTAVMAIGKELGFEFCEFDRQDRFLLRSGLVEELELRVSQVDREAEKLRLRTSVREMILPEGMAGKFQVLVQKRISDSGLRISDLKR
jgi:SAM-dependent MidA family methyltransferase